MTSHQKPFELGRLQLKLRDSEGESRMIVDLHEDISDYFLTAGAASVIQPFDEDMEGRHVDIPKYRQAGVRLVFGSIFPMVSGLNPRLTADLGGCTRSGLRHPSRPRRGKSRSSRSRPTILSRRCMGNTFGWSGPGRTWMVLRPGSVSSCTSKDAKRSANLKT